LAKKDAATLKPTHAIVEGHKPKGKLPLEGF